MVIVYLCAFEFFTNSIFQFLYGVWYSASAGWGNCKYKTIKINDDSNNNDDDSDNDDDNDNDDNDVTDDVDDTGKDGSW